MAQYTNVFQTYTQNQKIGCKGQNVNEITFINNGLVNVTLNNAISLVPGNSFGISGNENETDETDGYNITFASGAGASCVVIKKIML